MGVFRQLGDPLAGAVCLCEHHGAAYNEMAGDTPYDARIPNYISIPAGTAVLSQAITTTERCCINVTTAILCEIVAPETDFEIERPSGTIRTTQEDFIDTNQLRLMHHGAWEVLDPGTYTYYLMNRAVYSNYIFAAWMKIIASDCEG